MEFSEEIAMELIYNSCIHEESCISTSKTRNRNIPHNLETAFTHYTEYDGANGFVTQNLDTINKSYIGKKK